MTPHRGQTVHESHLVGGTSTTLPASPRPATTNTYRRFNAWGTLIAVYFLATGVLDLQLLGATSWVSSVFYGGVLVVAVIISTILNNKIK